MAGLRLSKDLESDVTPLALHKVMIKAWKSKPRGVMLGNDRNLVGDEVAQIHVHLHDNTIDQLGPI